MNNMLLCGFSTFLYIVQAMYRSATFFIQDFSLPIMRYNVFLLSVGSHPIILTCYILLSFLLLINDRSCFHFLLLLFQIAFHGTYGTWNMEHGLMLVSLCIHMCIS